MSDCPGPTLEAQGKVEECESSNWNMMSFAFRLPGHFSAELPPLDDSNPNNHQGLVGSVTLLKKSILIWISWGAVDPGNENNVASGQLRGLGRYFKGFFY